LYWCLLFVLIRQGLIIIIISFEFIFSFSFSFFFYGFGAIAKRAKMAHQAIVVLLLGERDLQPASPRHSTALCQRAAHKLAGWA